MSGNQSTPSEAAAATEEAAKAVAKATDLARRVAAAERPVYVRRSRLRFEVFRDRRGEYRWRLRAPNGQIVADSAEGYVRKSDCLRGMDLVRQVTVSNEVRDMT